MKIYTRGGDTGETSLFDGTRVSKADARVGAYGQIDELNAALGVVRATGVDPDLADMLDRVQRDLFALGARLADPRRRIAARVEKTSVEVLDAVRLETWIDQLEAVLPPLRRFILPGGSPAGAMLHHARTICRRAEREVVSLPAGSVDPEAVVYVNRLSDFLFVLARIVNHRAGVAEMEW